MFIYIYQAIIKDIYEQSGEEKHLGEAQKGPKRRSLCPWGAGECNPQRIWICSSIWMLFKPCSSQNFMEASPYQ